jgi:gliding motility-associated protein GldM
MIGMMYLVLTALLALNVSKQVLEAFAAIEDNTQRSNENLYFKGEDNLEALESELESLKEKDSIKIRKIKTYLSIIQKLDKETGKMIQSIDNIKFELLEEAGEEFEKNSPKLKDRDFIVWSKFNAKYPAKPVRFNLFKVQNKDNFDVPMHALVGSDIANITSKQGLKLWADFNALRNNMIQITGTYSESIDGKSKPYKVKVGDIDQFDDSKDLQKKLRKMMFSSSNNVNPADTATLQLVYELMSKNKMADYGENKDQIHWLGRTFDHAPLVGALASLSSLQNDILQAREKLIDLLKRKVTTGEFSFNQIDAFVAGDAVVTSGDELQISVTMAAYDTDKNPTVVINGGGNQVTGKGVVEVKKIVTGNGEQTISGTVTILSKSGEPYEKPWEHKYVIVAPQGSISLPELSVLYTDWENKIVPTVVGSVRSDITVENGTKSKKSWTDKEGAKYDGYYVKVNKGAKYVKIKLLGYDKDGKQKGYGTFSYKVKPFPTAQVSGGTISKSTGFIANVSLGADSPFNGVTFKVMSGFIDDQPFNGNIAPGSLVKSIRIGKKVAVELVYSKNGVKSQKNATGILKVVN